MTDTFAAEPVPPGVLPVAGKKPYESPTLVLFGQVGQLTQGASTCGDNDSSTCTTGAITMGPMVASDRNLKENLARIGTHSSGFGLYLFDYKPQFRAQWGRGRQFGVMADEVAQVMPQAVSLHADGYKLVNYGMLGIDRAVH